MPMNRDRLAYILISIVLLIAAVVVYLQEENGWILALTIAISAVVTYGSYWAGKWYKRKAQKRRLGLD